MQLQISENKVGDGKVLLALSGGVDSSVAAGLLSRAIGKQLTCVFVDHGLLRKNEGDEVEAVFGPEGNFDSELHPCQRTGKILQQTCGRDRTGTEAENYRRRIHPCI